MHICKSPRLYSFTKAKKAHKINFRRVLSLTLRQPSAHYSMTQRGINSLISMHASLLFLDPKPPWIFVKQKSPQDKKKRVWFLWAVCNLSRGRIRVFCCLENWKLSTKTNSSTWVANPADGCCWATQCGKNRAIKESRIYDDAQHSCCQKEEFLSAETYPWSVVRASTIT